MIEVVPRIRELLGLMVTADRYQTELLAKSLGDLDTAESCRQ